MTPDRFNECLDTLGWSLRSLSRDLNVNLVTVRRWSTGEREIPATIAEWLEGVEREVLRATATPPPERPPWPPENTD